MQIFTQLQNQIKLITHFVDARGNERINFLSEKEPQTSLDSNQFQSLFKAVIKIIEHQKIVWKKQKNHGH
jgi:hypothetical protein